MQTRLNVEEREKVFYYLSLNKSYRETGLLLGRSHMTIIREIKRNNKKGERSPSCVEKLSRVRYKKCGWRKKIDTNIDLFDEVFNKLLKKWSPEQISEYLKNKYNGNLQMQISHESIYQYIYAKPKGELKKHLLNYFRQKGRKNKAVQDCHAFQKIQYN